MNEREALSKAILLLSEEYLRNTGGWKLPEVVATLYKMRDALPEPPFCPTEPGWYWFEFLSGERHCLEVVPEPGRSMELMVLMQGGWKDPRELSGKWLGPVEPWKEDE